MNQTPLHIAAQHGHTDTVITLLFEGNANLTAIDCQKYSPFHLAKTSKILDILLSKTNSDGLNSLRTNKCLFKHIITNQPESIQTYLDLMVTKAHEDHYVFHLDMFKQNTTKSKNFLDKHKGLIAVDYPEMLRHPVMMFFMNLQWYPYKRWYYFNFSIFLMFLFMFTFHAVLCIDRNQCDCEATFNR